MLQPSIERVLRAAIAYELEEHANVDAFILDHSPDESQLNYSMPSARSNSQRPHSSDRRRDRESSSIKEHGPFAVIALASAALRQPSDHQQ